MSDSRVTWYRGTSRPTPKQVIGVLEVRAGRACRAVFGDRCELDGGTHIRLAREAWGWKDAMETRWWSLVLDAAGKAETVRNGSCGDALRTADVPVVVAALRELDLVAPRTVIHVDDGPPVCPGRAPVQSA
jgi:hypothetical protein